MLLKAMQVDVFYKKSKQTNKAWQVRACVKMDSKYMIYQGHVNYSITEGLFFENSLKDWLHHETVVHFMQRIKFTVTRYVRVS